jgi:hypothetical protein
MAEIKTKDRTVLRSLGLGGFFGGGARKAWWMSKTAKSSGVRPLRYGWKYEKGRGAPVEDRKGWKEHRVHLEISAGAFFAGL